MRLAKNQQIPDRIRASVRAADQVQRDPVLDVILDCNISRFEMSTYVAYHKTQARRKFFWSKPECFGTTWVVAVADAMRSGNIPVWADS